MGLVLGVVVSLVALPLGILAAAFGGINTGELAGRFVGFWIGCAMGLIGGIFGRRLGGVVMILGGLIALFTLGTFGIISFLLFIVGGVMAFRERRNGRTTSHAGGAGGSRVAVRVLTASQDMVCRSCGNLMPIGSKTCNNCGSRLYEERIGVKCPVCRAPLSYATKTSGDKLVCGICFSELAVERMNVSPAAEQRQTILSRDTNKTNKERIFWVVGILLALLFGTMIGSAGQRPTVTTTLTTTLVVTTTQTMPPLNTQTTINQGTAGQSGQTDVAKGTVMCQIPFVGTLQISILEYLRGDKANREMRQASILNREPKTGFEYLLIKVNVKHVAGANQIDVYPTFFQVFVDGIGHDLEIFATMPRDKSTLESRTLMMGASIDGWMAFIIPRDKEFTLAYRYVDVLCLVRP